MFYQESLTSTLILSIIPTCSTSTGRPKRKASGRARMDTKNFEKINQQAIFRGSKTHQRFNDLHIKNFRC
jgi:hypothetical protein